MSRDVLRYLCPLVGCTSPLMRWFTWPYYVCHNIAVRQARKSGTAVSPIGVAILVTLAIAFVVLAVAGIIVGVT